MLARRPSLRCSALSRALPHVPLVARYVNGLSGPDHEQLLFAPAGVKPAGLLQPLGARHQHRPERNPLPRNDFGIQSGVGERGEGLPLIREFGLHHQQAAAVGQQVGHGPAQRVKHQSPVVAGVPAVSAWVNVLALQRMLGHTSAKVTPDTYADLFDDDLDAVAVTLDSRYSRESVAKMWPRGSEDVR